MLVTAFQKRVYDIVSTIPKGYVSTYQAVAVAAGCGSARAVGQALRRNPFAPRVPCHRVISANLSLGGFQGETGGAALQRKEQLLRSEGVVFRQGRLEEPLRVYAPRHSRGTEQRDE